MHLGGMGGEWMLVGYGISGWRPHATKSWCIVLLLLFSSTQAIALRRACVCVGRIIFFLP